MSNEIIESPQVILTAAAQHTKEAIETIVKIMRTSESEKMRLLAAAMILDRATVTTRARHTPGSSSSSALPAPTVPEAKQDMRAKLERHLNDNRGDDYDEQRLKTELELRSPPTQIRATLVQMYRDGIITRTDAGTFTAK